jgi:hypothetical protein
VRKSNCTILKRLTRDEYSLNYITNVKRHHHNTNIEIWNHVTSETRRVNGFHVKNAVFWVVAPCGSCKNRRFGGTFRLHLQVGKTREPEMSNTFLARVFFYPEDRCETSVLTRSTRCHIPEDGILHSHRRENLKSYTISCNFIWLLRILTRKSMIVPNTNTRIDKKLRTQTQHANKCTDSKTYQLQHPVVARYMEIYIGIYWKWMQGRRH